MTEVRYRIDGGAWLLPTPSDGAFDSAYEEFTFTTDSLSVGQHLSLEVTAVNNVENQVPKPTVSSVVATRVIIDQGTVSASRVSVGSSQKVSFRAVWAHDQAPVTQGTPSINDQQCPLDNMGWCSLTSSAPRASRLEFAVTAVQAGAVRSYVHPAPKQAIIWDRVQVTGLTVSDSRANVGDTVHIMARAKLEYDGTVLGPDGYLAINGQRAQYEASAGSFKLSVVRRAVGRDTFRVTQARDGQFGVTAVADLAGLKEVVWDRIVVKDLALGTPRTNIGSAVPVRVTAHLEYDGTPLSSSDQVFINGERARLLSTPGLYEQVFRRDRVTIEAVHVTAARQAVFGITALSDQAGFRTIVWDKVDITEFRVSDVRADAGTEQRVFVKAVLAFDGTPLGAEDAVTVNGRQALWDPTAAAFSLSVHLSPGQSLMGHEGVGRDEFQVTEVRQTGYGITVLSDQARFGIIVWDKVDITEFWVSDARADAGSEQQVFVKAVLAFDGTPLGAEDAVTVNGREALWDPTAAAFSLPVRLSPGQGLMGHEGVGREEFQVTEVHQTGYGVTAFSAPESRGVIWDKVLVEIQTSLPRVEVGHTAPLQVKGRYAYDGAFFPGGVRLNRPSTTESLGPVVYTASTVTDPLFSLTAFETNTATVIFDRLVPRIDIATRMPGRIEVKMALQYASDLSVVEEASVVTNGMPIANVDDGYSAFVGLWLPYTVVKAEVTKVGFAPIVLSRPTVVLGNAGALLLLISICVGAGLVVWRKLRRI